MKVGSICSGAGIHLHGWSKPAWAIECDKEIAQCYKDNHGDNIIVEYVQNVDIKSLLKVDCIVATPSCKNASICSNGQETEEDLTVAQSISSILKLHQPKYFVLENVAGYQNFTSYDVIVNSLEQLGYFWESYKLNLADFGIAQNRKRLYVIAKQSPLPLIVFPQIKKLGWYEAIEDLIPSLPSSFLTNWQQKLLNQRATPFPEIYAVKRNGASCKQLRPLLQDEPMYTWRAFGRRCANHWQQVNTVINNQVKAITPRAALRFFGGRAIADKIILPQRQTIASECVGNGASWEIFKFLIEATGERIFSL